jgi:hypothetical protein
MRRSHSLGVVIVPLLAACAGKSGAGQKGVAPDLVRSQMLAEALQTGAAGLRPIPSTLKLSFSPEAVSSGVSGSAIVAFVVRPNGRVDRESRTLVFVEGHPIYAKHICDALLAAKFEPVPTDPRGGVATFPVFFAIKDGPARDSAQLKFREAGQVVARRLRSMTFDEALTWFQARPPCSALKIGIDAWYGPPPQ